MRHQRSAQKTADVRVLAASGVVEAPAARVPAATSVRGSARRRERAIEMLGSAAVRVTRGRVAIIELLLRELEPLSAAEILGRLGAAAPDRVTVYRCLTALAQAGILQEVLSLDRVRRYGISRPAVDLQVRFRCAGCGRVTSRVAAFDVPGVPTGFVVSGQVFSVEGLCADCA